MAVAAAPAAQGAQCVDSSDAAFDSAGIAVSETWRRTARSCELLRLSRVPRLQRFRSADAPARRICARSSAGQLPGRCHNLDLGEFSPINSGTGYFCRTYPFVAPSIEARTKTLRSIGGPNFPGDVRKRS